MIYPIVVYGDPILRKRGKDIEPGSIEVKHLSEDMFETMENAHGLGLAGPQIGKSIRMFVVDGRPMQEEGMENFKKVFINPEILEEGGEKWMFEEGCLSIPSIREDISRRQFLVIRYFDENWVQHEEEFDGVQARIIQHEHDHVEGILFTDHLPPLKKKLLKGRLTNISKGKVKIEYQIKVPG